MNLSQNFFSKDDESQFTVTTKPISKQRLFSQFKKIKGMKTFHRKTGTDGISLKNANFIFS